MIDAKLQRMKGQYAQWLNRGVRAQISYGRWKKLTAAVRQISGQAAKAGQATVCKSGSPVLGKVARGSAKVGKVAGPLLVAGVAIYDTVNTPYDDTTDVVFGPHIDAFFESLIDQFTISGIPQPRERPAPPRPTGPKLDATIILPAGPNDGIPDPEQLEPIRIIR